MAACGGRFAAVAAASCGDQREANENVARRMNRTAGVYIGLLIR